MEDQLSQIKQIIKDAKNILIALSANADEDTAAASLGLYLLLKKNSKEVTIASSQDITVGKAHLFAIDKITKKVTTGKNMVVSLPYKEGTIEKVSYNIEGDMFNLVIEPRGETLDFDPKKIQYSSGSGNVDAVFIMGAQQLDDLGELYSSQKSLFQEKPLVNIDKSPENTRFGKINIISPHSVSYAITALIKALGYQIDQDPASNLYTGIVSSKKNVTLDTVSADILDALAFLAKAKAVNLQKPEKKKEEIILEEKEEKAPVQPKKEEPAQTASEEEETPEDWLKPKIFTTDTDPQTV